MTGSLEKDLTEREDARDSGNAKDSMANFNRLSDLELFGSPYLQHSYSNVNPVYIFPEGIAKQRTRFDIVFGDIGAGIAAGSVLGSGGGLWHAMRDAAWKNQSARLKLTTSTNYVIKHAKNLTTAFGVIGIYYSAIAVGCQKLRDSDDDWNNLISGFCTGVIYCSASGVRPCLIAGCVGLGLGSLYCLAKHQLEEIK